MEDKELPVENLDTENASFESQDGQVAKEVSWMPTNGKVGRPRHGKNSPWKTKVLKILNHKTDKHGVKFEVMWADQMNVSYEKHDVIVLKGARSILEEYIKGLNKGKDHRRFTNMINRCPMLAELYLKNSSSELCRGSDQLTLTRGRGNDTS